MIAFCACVVHAAWPVNTNSVTVPIDSQVSKTFSIPQGEVRVIEARFVSGTNVASMTNMTAQYLYKTPEAALWNIITGTVDVVAGSARVEWNSTYDTGAPRYMGWFRVLTAATNPAYRVQVDLTMITTPGFVPNATALTVAPIDCSTLSFTNEPWATPSWVSGNFMPIVAVTSVVAGVAMITNTADILRSGDGTGNQGLTLSAARTNQLDKADLAYGWVTNNQTALSIITQDWYWATNVLVSLSNDFVSVSNSWYGSVAYGINDGDTNSWWRSCLDSSSATNFMATNTIYVMATNDSHIAAMGLTNGFLSSLSPVTQNVDVAGFTFLNMGTLVSSNITLGSTALGTNLLAITNSGGNGYSLKMSVSGSSTNLYWAAP